MSKIFAIFKRNMLNFVSDRTRLIFSLIMPLFFLFIFSFVMNSAMSGMTQPMNYLISGIIIMTVFQTSLNNSMNILEDISSGFMKEIIVSPIARWEISIGQVLSSTVIAVLQGVIIVVIGFFMGLSMDAVHLIEMLGVMIITGFAFSSLGLFLATLTRNSSSFQVLITVIVMPLTFLSGAYIPTTVMPSFMLPVILINPLTHITSIFRFITMSMENLPVSKLLDLGVAFKLGGLTITPIFGLFMIVLFFVVFFALCVYKFNKADFSAVKTFHHHEH
jgi:ABC-2 type transport system permease protein